MTQDDTTNGAERTRRGGRGRGTSAAPLEPRIVSRRPSNRSASDDAERAIGEAKREADESTTSSTPAAGSPRRGSRGGRGRGQGGAAAAAAEQPRATAAATPETADAAPVRQTRTARGASANGGAGAGATDDLAGALHSVREALEDLTQRMTRLERRQRLAVFVDVPNVIYGAERGDQPIDMGKLLDMVSEGRELIRATAYSPVSDNPSEPVERQKFVAPFVPHEYRIITKPLKRFADGSIKGNFDVEMAVDMVTMADKLDVICILSGDADFAHVVEVIQSRGVRVEVVAFGNSTSAEMRAIADHYIELGAIAHLLH